MQKNITSIEVQEKNKGRVNVFLNDIYGFSCNTEIIYRLNLKKGDSVDENYIKEVVEEDDYIKAKNIGLKSLERSYKSQKEVETNLIKKGFGESIIKRVIEFLETYNFIDDVKYADAYVHNNMISNGKNKIKFSLIKKGINKYIIEEALNKINDVSEEENALKLAEKKLSSLIIAGTGKDKNKTYKSIGDFLIRKGYDSDTVKLVLSKVIKDIPEGSTVSTGSDSGIIEVLAEKRYSILVKSENDSRKLYKKLADYLMRRGFTWEEVKSVVDNITNQ